MKKNKKVIKTILQKKKLAEMKNVLVAQGKNLNIATEIHELDFFKCV